jgi:hypothetical protein
MPCTACCEGWLTDKDILGHELKPGHPCPHSKQSGCAVYERRPEIPCRSFICSWLSKDSPLPDWMRPDLSGAIVLLSLRWEGELVISAVPVGDEIPPATLQWLQAYAREHQRPMIYYQRLRENERYCGLQRLGYGPAAFRQKVADLGLASAGAEVAMYAAADSEQF